VERDFDDVVAASLDEREARLRAAAPSAAALAATLAAVRRRHRRRRTGESFAAVGVAAALVVAIALGGGRDEARLAIEPTPSLTRTASPSPTAASPSPEPTPTGPTQAEIDAGLGLPETVAAPEDIWGQTGQGWALGVYRPYSLVDERNPTVRNTLVLASPDGTDYLVRELPLDTRIELVRWEPGATKALVTIAPVRDGSTGLSVRGWMDLRTGKLSEDPGAVGQKDAEFEPQITFRGTDHRGNEIWVVTYAQTGGGGPATIVVQKPDGTLVRRIDFASDSPEWGRSLLDPSGHLLVLPGHDDAEATFDVVDLDTGEEAAYEYGVREKFCQVVGWRSADELLTRCRDQPWSATGYDVSVLHGRDPLYVVNLDGRAPRLVWTLAEGDPAVPLWGAITAPDGRIVVGTRPVGSDDDNSCRAGLYALEDDHGTPLGNHELSNARPSGAVGTTIYAVTSLGCATSDVSGDQLESLDGTTRTALLRPPAATSGQIDGGLETWVIAGGPAGRS
jgi:hypothetical protein